MDQFQNALFKFYSKIVGKYRQSTHVFSHDLPEEIKTNNGQNKTKFCRFNME